MMLLNTLKTFSQQLTAIMQRCMICHQRSHRTKPLCWQCEPLLPWLEHVCKRCATPLEKGNLRQICKHCLNHPDHFYAARSLFCFAYQTPIDTMIKAWKFHQHWPMHFFLSQCLIEYLKQNLPHHHWPEAIIAVPASQQRLKERGFNQASILTKAISKAFHLPRLDHFIQCSKHHPHQASLKAYERSYNLNNAFRLVSHKSLPQHIAIVDDVMTTGATCQAVAQLLIDHGVKTIQYWGLARTIKYNQ